MIIYKRSVPFPIAGTRRFVNADIEERFPDKETFAKWYDANHEVPIDKSIAPKFICAIRDGETCCGFTDVKKNTVKYYVR